MRLIVCIENKAPTTVLAYLSIKFRSCDTGNLTLTMLPGNLMVETRHIVGCVQFKNVSFVTLTEMGPYMLRLIIQKPKQTRKQNILTAIHS